jgi:hypothetical protein
MNCQDRDEKPTMPPHPHEAGLRRLHAGPNTLLPYSDRELLGCPEPAPVPERRYDLGAAYDPRWTDETLAAVTQQARVWHERSGGVGYLCQGWTIFKIRQYRSTIDDTGMPCWEAAR